MSDEEKINERFEREYSLLLPEQKAELRKADRPKKQKRKKLMVGITPKMDAKIKALLKDGVFVTTAEFIRYTINLYFDNFLKWEEPIK